METLPKNVFLAVETENNSKAHNSFFHQEMGFQGDFGFPKFDTSANSILDSLFHHQLKEAEEIILLDDSRMNDSTQFVRSRFSDGSFAAPCFFGDSETALMAQVHSRQIAWGQAGLELGEDDIRKGLNVLELNTNEGRIVLFGVDHKGAINYSWDERINAALKAKIEKFFGLCEVVGEFDNGSLFAIFHRNSVFAA